MSTQEEKIKKEIIQRLGDAYKSFGLNKLMGHIIALLIYSKEPLSLTQISKELGRTKGPVSQTLKRLYDRKLVRKVWFPEDNRSDFYEAEPDIFVNAFRNQSELIKNNTRIVQQIKEKVIRIKNNEEKVLQQRISEMEAFYLLMEKYNRKFMKEWAKERKKIVKLQ